MTSSPAVGQSMLQMQLVAARQRTDELFALLQRDAVYDRPVSERHRLIFYLGHLEAFDWNQVCRGALEMPSFHPEFDKLFEFGIDPPPGQAPADTPSDWPSIWDVQSYQAEVRRRLDEVLAEAPEQNVQIAIEHRLMHAETFAYLIHNLPYDRKIPVTAPVREGLVPRNLMISVPGGTATLGQSLDRFGWDNEFPQHTVSVPGFSISKYKVTNGEYLAFVEAGAPHPHFWSRRDGQWFYRGMFRLIPLPLDWPVYVTQTEASAYAHWAGRSLLTEGQFHRAAEGIPAHAGNFDFRHWDPVSVTADSEGDSAWGVSQLIGNGWEWTSTVFAPFDGFRPFPSYPGYSQNFFDEAHFILKGASPRTAACFTRPSFRNWFRPDYPYVYAGFRLIEN